MNSSTQNDLQLSEDNAESTSTIVEKSSTKNGDRAHPTPFLTDIKFASLPLGTPITPKEVDIIKLTAQFVAVYGISFCVDLQKLLLKKPELDPHFVFMKKSDNSSKLCFYDQLIDGYFRVLLISRKLRNHVTSTETVLEGFFNLLHQLLQKEEDEQGVEMAMFDFHAFQFFANMEYDIPLFKEGPFHIQPDATTHDAETIRFPLIPQGITHKELHTIKLTAQFLAVYGMGFGQGLMESVFPKPELEPQFRFMKSTDSRCSFYSDLSLAYKRVLRPSKKLKDQSISMKTLLEGFFKLHLKVLEKNEKGGAEIAIIDLHAFEYFSEVEHINWSPPLPGFLSILKCQQPKTSQPQPEEPEPKRQKLALVPEDQFLAQNQLCNESKKRSTTMEFRGDANQRIAMISALLQPSLTPQMEAKNSVMGRENCRAKGGNPGFKVSILGAAGGIGQPLALLMKMNPLVSLLHLYDVVNAPGVTADVSHMDTGAVVRGFLGAKQLEDALTGMDLVIIPAGVPRKPGMTRDDLFKINAGIVKTLCEGVAKSCPNAIVNLISNPVNSTVAIAAEVFKKAGTYDPKKLLGVTTLDVARANTFVAEVLGLDPREVDVPVVGGHAGVTILPLLSQVKPPSSFTPQEIEYLTNRIQNGGTEVVEAKAGAGSATLSMAYAASKFADACLRGLRGDANVIEYSFVASQVTELAFFATKVRLGRTGAEEVYQLGLLNEYERIGLEKAKEELVGSIQKGVEFIRK